MELQDGAVNSLADTVLTSETRFDRVLGSKYQLGECLGRGSVGTVYLASRSVIGGEVAVKILHTPHTADPILVQRMHREACAAAQINDPRVVKIHDYCDKSSEGLVYIVMEYVEGVTLHAALEHEKKLTPRRAVALMLEICQGVAAAHKLGIVHRDLKPGNIILVPSRRGELEGVKVVDFGTCKLLHLAADNALTEPGVLIGTPYYMAPEQCRGESVDKRADVYSLGAMFYEMLAGAPPFSAKSMVELLAKHLYEEPATLLGKSGLTRRLNKVITRALAKDPEGRQSDAAELAREIEEAIDPPKRNTTPGPKWQGLVHQLSILVSGFLFVREA